MSNPKIGDLRVWHNPQIGTSCPSFYVPVATPEEAILLLNTLAKYDLFQFKHRVRGDYANAGGLLEYEPENIIDGDPDSGWTDWSNEEGESIDEVIRNRAQQ